MTKIAQSGHLSGSFMKFIQKNMPWQICWIHIGKNCYFSQTDSVNRTLFFISNHMFNTLHPQKFWHLCGIFWWSLHRHFHIWDKHSRWLLGQLINDCNISPLQSNELGFWSKVQDIGRYLTKKTHHGTSLLNPLNSQCMLLILLITQKREQLHNTCTLLSQEHAPQTSQQIQHKAHPAAWKSDIKRYNWWWQAMTSSNQTSYFFFLVDNNKKPFLMTLSSNDLRQVWFHVVHNKLSPIANAVPQYSQTGHVPELVAMESPRSWEGTEKWLVMLMGWWGMLQACL